MAVIVVAVVAVGAGLFALWKRSQSSVRIQRCLVSHIFVSTSLRCASSHLQRVPPAFSGLKSA